LLLLLPQPEESVLFEFESPLHESLLELSELELPLHESLELESLELESPLQESFGGGGGAFGSLPQESELVSTVTLLPSLTVVSSPGSTTTVVGSPF
jgi:hypothetical protein